MRDSVTIVGKMGRDPDLKQKYGAIQAWASVSTSKTIRNNNGEKVSVAKWHNVCARDASAAAISKCKKGDIIVVFGRLDYYKKKAYNANGVPFEYSVAYIDAISIERL